MKPYVICHSMSSVDGRLQSFRWGIKNAARLFEKTAAHFKVDAWIVGRTTMQEFSVKKKRRLGRPPINFPRTDFIGEHKAKTYAVAIDPMGKCQWAGNMVGGDHVIEVVCGDVSGAFLKHLRQKQVSYIFAGGEDLDLGLALTKLRRLFGIRRCRIDGGGKVNGSFLKTKLIDEFSHIIVPVADGSLKTPTVFDVDTGERVRRASKLRLKNVKRLAGGVLWIRYAVG
jgi:2,5-diamino-6-(ribosylamino)-4(3H)-pyrimidinone 5'-phosphate reductase